MAEKKSNEKQVLRVLSNCGYTIGGAPAAVDVKDDKIVRIRGLKLDSKYSREQLRPWKMQRNGKTIEEATRAHLAPFSLAYKKRAYSPNRILYPLKRVDWDPNGNRNTQNRGVSKYQRISWDEAAELVASEIKRVHAKYGHNAILAQADGHGESKIVSPAHGCQLLLHDTLGGFTQQQRNPDSWEGWYWGAMHVWGTAFGGLMTPSDNVVKDVTEHSDMVLFWSCDPETTTWGNGEQYFSEFSYFWKDAGIKQVYICPDLNYGAAVHADKWIPVLPNTDAALQLAIIYTWLIENTYDKEYVKTHAVGMDKLTDYVLGKEDGIPKSPEWASPKCGVPVWTIKALAREFARQPTSISHMCGGNHARGPYSHEVARLEIVLLAMQGLGRPGVHVCTLIGISFPRASIAEEAQINLTAWVDTEPGDRIRRPHAQAHSVAAKQFIPKNFVNDAILNPPLTFSGRSTINASVDDQFIQYTYPLPKEEGGTEIHMIWADTVCRSACWNDGMKVVEAYRDPKIECIVVQQPWMENDTVLADIILPAATTFEMNDIAPNFFHTLSNPCLLLQKQAIKPIGESKTDYEIVLEVAKKLGKYEEVTQGKTTDEWIKNVYDISGLPNLITWKEFEENQYYVFPTAEDWENDPAGMIKFYEDPEANPLPTPSGKLEFYSARLAEYYPDDAERSPIPRWVEKSESHDERRGGERAKKYPLLFVSNHPRWRMHAQCDDISWTREVPTMKVTGYDGYKYEPLWIHPSDAKARGIENGDIVRIYNERGTILGGAYVTERIIPGGVLGDHGSRVDWIIPGKLDRGGSNNLISPDRPASKNAGGQATTGFLVQVEKVSKAQMEEWKRQYPDAFERDYDAASGLQFKAWVVDKQEKESSSE